MTVKATAKYPSEAHHGIARSVLQIPLFFLDTLRACSFALFLLFVILSFLRPLETFWPEILDSRPMLWIWIASFASGLLNALHRRRIGARPIHFALLAFFVIVIMLSMVANGWAGGALQAAGEFSASAMIFVVAALNLTSIERIRMTCATLVVTMLAATSLSLYSYYTGFEWKTFVLQQSNMYLKDFPGGEPFGFVPADDTSGYWLWRIRGVGFLNDPNDFAQMMVMALPLLWAYAGVLPVARKGTLWSTLQNLFRFCLNRLPGLRPLLFAGVPAALLLFGIYMTQSRGAVLGAASLLFFSVHRQLGNVRTAILIGIAGVALLTLSVVGGRGMSMKESSADDRIGAWGAAIQMIKSKPILGVGYNNFVEHHTLTAHNSFVLCLAELGIVGFLPWIALLVLSYQSLQQVITHRPKHDEHRRLAILLQSSLLGYLTCAWFLSRSYSTGLFFLIALCCSVSVSMGYQLAAQKRAANRNVSAGTAGVDPVHEGKVENDTPDNNVADTARIIRSTHPYAQAAIGSNMKHQGPITKATVEPVFGKIPATHWIPWTLIAAVASIGVIEAIVIIGRGGG